MGSRGDKLSRTGHAALRALCEAVAEAIREHHRAGRPVAVAKNGRVMLLYPGGRLVAARSPRRAA